MARSLNKKYFGNRNVGANSTLATGEVLTAGAEIGGEGVESVSQPVGGVGSFVVNDTYRNFPTLTASAPTIANGVTAILSPVFEIETVSYASGGATGYANGLSTSITSFSPASGASVNIVLTLGAVTSVNLTGANRGEFRVGDFTGQGITTRQVLQAPNSGTDLQINVTFRVKRIEVTTKGSGYVSAPSLTWGGHTFTGQTVPSLNQATLTTDSGSVGSVTNRENAIIAYAYISGSLVEVDIQRQVSSKRYRVNKSGDTSREGARIARIRYDAEADGTKGYTAAEGVELNIVAIDSDGGTYLVRKLTNHTAVVVPMAIARLSSSAGTQFPATTDAYGIVRHKSVSWTFNGTTAPKVLNERPLLQSGVNVKLENA